MWLLFFILGCNPIDSSGEPTPKTPEPVEAPAPARPPSTPFATRFGHPLVVAHRGASGQLPEHTLQAYTRAVLQGADFIEPDLVPTRDGHLISRHEHDLRLSTNVADVFPERKTTKVIEGKSVESWFSEDFTLSEIKQLRARQSKPFRDPSHNDRYTVPTLEEILLLVERLEVTYQRRIGIYPELKSPAYFARLKLATPDRLLQILSSHGYDDAGDPILIQCFEPATLRALAERTDIRLMQLLHHMETEPDLEDIASYASGVAISKRSFTHTDAQGYVATDPDFVRRAHTHGLSVHVYTFRDEPRFLDASFEGDPLREYQAFYRSGIDGVFSDFPQTAMKVRPPTQSGH